MKLFILILFLCIISSCSSNSINSNEVGRYIAEESNCVDSIKNFAAPKVNSDEDSKLIKSLADKKLIKVSEKIITVNYPPLDWYNKVRKTLISKIKSWNKNQYPLFYLDQESNILTTAKSYFSLIKKESENSLSDSEKTLLNSIKKMLDDYKNYPSQLDAILQERISLQYNIDILKKLKLKENEPLELKINSFKDGKIVSEIITIRKEDHNQQFIISNLKKKIKELDGSILSYGKIHDRILKQAMLKDILTVFHRELEYSIKNSNEDLEVTKNVLKDLETLLSSNEFIPSSYGVYKINSELFKREFFDLFVSDKISKNIMEESDNSLVKLIRKVFTDQKIESLLNSLIDVGENNKKATPEKTDNFFKKLYIKIATLSPYQKAIGSAELGLVGYGTYRYFWFNKTSESEGKYNSNLEPEVISNNFSTEEIDLANKIENQSSNAKSQVIVEEINNLNLKN